MRHLLVIFLVLLVSVDGYGQRKKVGLVLSGGGAKGVAHIGALKVLHEAGIPIDYIAGTSMGSIVGGLYAIGYDAHRLDSMVRTQDWAFLLSDKVYRYNLPFSEKERDEKYLISFPLSVNSRLKLPSGFISGQNIYNLFSELTIGYHDTISFLKMPIPFSCVASNLADGSAVVLNNGNLPLAMRASMAIPGVFTAVKMDSLVLVDGGIANNFPTNVARDMGAEIIIGIDVTSGLKDVDQLNSVMDVFDQLTTFMGRSMYEKNIKLANLYIKPNIVPYSAASFSTNAIDTLIQRGEDAARAMWDDIMKLKAEIGLDTAAADSPKINNPLIKTDSIAIGLIQIDGIDVHDEKWIRTQIGLKEFSVITMSDLHRAIATLYGTGAFAFISFELIGDGVYTLALKMQEKPMGSINFGFRFDTKEMAAILLNTSLSHKNLRGSSISLTGRLSQNPYVRIDYSIGSTFLRRIGLTYMFRYNNIDTYERGDKTDNVEYAYHLGELSFSDIYIRNYKFTLGLRYEYFDYNSFLYASDLSHLNVRPEGYFSYYVAAHYESLDKKYYPEKGVSIRGDYSLYTDNMWQYKKGTPFSAIALNVFAPIKITRRVFVIPAVYGRVLMGNNVPYAYLNRMGGEVAGRYVSQQLPFVGIQNMEFFNNSIVAVRADLRYRLGAKHYISLIGNYAKCDDNFFDLLGADDIWGGGAKYSYNSIVGPIDLTISYSNWDENLGAYFSLGYFF